VVEDRRGTALFGLLLCCSTNGDPYRSWQAGHHRDGHNAILDGDAESTRDPGSAGADDLVRRSISFHVQERQYSAQILKKRASAQMLITCPGPTACFRKQGLEVIPAACGYRSYGNGLHSLVQLLPNWEPIGWNEDTLHEYLGLDWYWSRGWISKRIFVTFETQTL